MPENANHEPGNKSTSPDATLPSELTADTAAAQASNPIYRFLVYGLSLPERTIRSSSAIVGGALKESADLLLPTAFRNSRSYKSLVGQMLDFMVNDVAGVPRDQEDAAAPEVENYVARKTVSSFVDLAGMATLHLSPLAVLAIVSDVAYGSQEYLKELAAELKKEGVIAEHSTIDSTADLLAAIGNTAGKSADAFDTPPISVEGLRETIQQTRDAVAGVDPARVVPMAEIDRTWQEMRSMAEREGVSLFGLSSAVTLFTLNRVQTAARGALSTIRVSGNLFDRHIVEHYRSGLSEIREQGIWQSLSNNSRPYVDAVWTNFRADQATITEDLVSGKLISSAWNGVLGWFSGTSRESPADPSSEAKGPAPFRDHDEPSDPATP